MGWGGGDQKNPPSPPLSLLPLSPLRTLHSMFAPRRLNIQHEIKFSARRQTKSLHYQLENMDNDLTSMHACMVAKSLSYHLLTGTP